MELSKVLQDIKVKKINADPSVEVTGITQNSRRIQKGYIFVALKGARFD